LVSSSFLVIVSCDCSSILACVRHRQAAISCMPKQYVLGLHCRNGPSLVLQELYTATHFVSPPPSSMIRMRRHVLTCQARLPWILAANLVTPTTRTVQMELACAHPVHRTPSALSWCPARKVVCSLHAGHAQEVQLVPQIVQVGAMDYAVPDGSATVWVRLLGTP
jgi:hypothetical protein